MKNTTERQIVHNKEMEVGDSVVLLSDIENGLIKLKQFDKGVIVHRQNQVSASVWFRDVGQYANDDVFKALQLDMGFKQKSKMDGIVLDLPRDTFAIVLNNSKDFDNISIWESKLENIPFFKHVDAYRFPTNFQKNIGNGVFKTECQYYIRDVEDIINSNFIDWTRETLKTRKITKSEKESGDYPYDWDNCLTTESEELFDKKKKEVDLAFAKSTGYYYDFDGGLLEE